MDTPWTGRMSQRLAVPCVEPRGYFIVKGVIEWLVAGALLFLTSPLIALLIVVLKCSSEGPGIYSQLRLGRHGRVFRMYKLRTMTHGCEIATGPVWAIEDDPRVTKLGRWLRATHVDELPQLWNILRGEMSLIGPRPERPEIAAVIERTLPEFRHRLQVRPGITGLAQLQLPASAELHAVRHKLERDFLYLQEFGPAIDARIAFATVCHFVSKAFGTICRHIVQPFTPVATITDEPDTGGVVASLASFTVERRVAAPDAEFSRAA